MFIDTGVLPGHQEHHGRWELHHEPQRHHHSGHKHIQQFDQHHPSHRGGGLAPGRVSRPPRSSRYSPASLLLNVKGQTPESHLPTVSYPAGFSSLHRRSAQRQQHGWTLIRFKM